MTAMPTDETNRKSNQYYPWWLDNLADDVTGEGAAMQGVLQRSPIRTFRSRRGGTHCSRGLPIHLVNHLATMADLPRAGRYDRLTDDVLTLTEQMPMNMQEVVRKNAATFTDSAKAA